MDTSLIPSLSDQMCEPMFAVPGQTFHYLLQSIVNRCLLILDLKSLGSYVKGNHSIDRDFQSLAVREK